MYFNERVFSRILGLFLISVAILLGGCASKQAQDEEIKIGFIGPFSGPVARFGEYMKEGVEIAVEEVNEKGGIRGKQVKLIPEDTKCVDLAAAVSALHKLNDVDGVAAVLGPYCGSESTLAGQFSTDSKLFILTMGDNFGKTGEYIVGTRYLIEDEGKLIAKHIIEQGWKNVAILHYNNDWGLAYKETIEEEISKVGGKIVASETYTWDNIDVRSQLLKIRDVKPDVFVLLDGTSGELFNQAYELGLEIPLLSEWEIEKPEAMGVAGQALEGVVYFLPSFESTAFTEHFKEDYARNPNVVNVDAYDAAMILFKALEQCENEDPDCILEFVTSLKDYQGGGGLMSFDKDRWGFKKSFVKKTVKDGTFVVFEE